MEINVNLNAKLTMNDGYAELLITDDIADGDPWYKQDAGLMFIRSLQEAIYGDGQAKLSCQRPSGHRLKVCVRDKDIDTSWAHE